MGRTKQTRRNIRTTVTRQEKLWITRSQQRFVKNYRTYIHPVYRLWVVYQGDLYLVDGEETYGANDALEYRVVFMVTKQGGLLADLDGTIAKCENTFVPIAECEIPAVPVQDKLDRWIAKVREGVEYHDVYGGVSLDVDIAPLKLEVPGWLRQTKEEETAYIMELIRSGFDKKK